MCPKKKRNRVQVCIWYWLEADFQSDIFSTLSQPLTQTGRRWRTWCRGFRTVSVFPPRQRISLTTSMSSTVHLQAAGGSPATPEVGHLDGYVSFCAFPDTCHVFLKGTLLFCHRQWGCSSSYEHWTPRSCSWSSVCRGVSQDSVRLNVWCQVCWSLLKSCQARGRSSIA